MAEEYGYEEMDVAERDRVVEEPMEPSERAAPTDKEAASTSLLTSVTTTAKTPAPPKPTTATRPATERNLRTTITLITTNDMQTMTTTAKAPPLATTLTTTTVKPMPYNSLICVLNANMIQKNVSELPEDGLCDFTFFQAYEKEHAILKGVGGPFNSSLQLIFEAAGQHTKTEYGISFDFNSIIVTQPLVAQKDTRKILEDLWKKKIYHYTFLTLPFFGLEERNYRKVYYYLREVYKQLHKGMKSPRPNYYLVGESFYAPPWIHYAFNNVRQRMHPHGLVGYGHSLLDDRGKGRVVPPTFWNSTLLGEKVYPYNLDTAHWALGQLTSMRLGYTQFFLSVTTGARYYMPPSSEKCEIMAKNGFITQDQLFVDIGQVCKDKDWSRRFHNKSPAGAYYANEKAHKVVTYDDERSFREKLCKGKKRIPQLKYGIAVYDANMDDPRNVCGNGAYSRLRFLKKLMDFFNNKFLRVDDHHECLKVA